MKEEVVVLYPAPGIGHLVSLVELAKRLLLHHQHTNTTTTTATKFSIIILLATGSHLDSSATASYIHRISLTNPSITFRRFPALASSSSSAASSSPSASARSGAAIIFEFIRLNAANVLRALQEISVTHTVRALIIDLFCTSALPIARDLRIPVYYFFASGAAVLGCFFYFPTVDKQINSNKSFKDLTSTYLRFPGLPPIPAPHAPEPLLDRDDPAFADFIYFCENLPNPDGIIVNTFNDLEPISVKTIATGACVPPNSITPPIYYIGPLIAASSSVVESVNQAEARDDRLMSWLDSQPRQSVVYLCFGSRGSFSPAQITEMANGLESSGQRFLWVIKSKSGTQDVHLLLPDGFLERTKGRGVVTTTWVPQVEVLSHESVGGFVTHCGWNSVLEAVVAGVPMVAWPLYAEQHVNKAVLVENMKMAIPLEVREGDGGFVSAIELAKRVRELMESEVGRGLRERSRKMKEMAIAAWGESGSSTTALAKLVGLWKNH